MRGNPAAFDFPGGEHGVLCVHGFTGSPYEMRYLGQRLSQRGYTAVGPCLPGHASTIDDLDTRTWHQWYQEVESAFEALRQRCARVAVVGQSLGALLSLHLARQRGDEMVAVGSLAAPLWLGPLARAVVRLTEGGAPLERIVRRLPKGGGSDLRDPVARRANPTYLSIPTRALHQLVDIMHLVRRELREVRVPALVMHARSDHTAPFACSQYMIGHLGSREIRYRPLEESFHLIAIDVERDIVAAEVGTFFDRQFANGDS